MKIVFDVEKTDSKSGKKYYPGIPYEMSEEKAKAILASTKYAHEYKEVERKENKKKSKKSSVNEEKQEESSAIVENVENTVEKINIDN